MNTDNRQMYTLYAYSLVMVSLWSEVIHTFSSVCQWNMGPCGPPCTTTFIYPVDQGCFDTEHNLTDRRWAFHWIYFKVIAAIFLFLVFFVSITGNSLIISTVGSSLTLRRLHYNLLLLQVLGTTSIFWGTSFVFFVTSYHPASGWGVWHCGDGAEHQFEHSLPSHSGGEGVTKYTSVLPSHVCHYQCDEWNVSNLRCWKIFHL